MISVDSETVGHPAQAAIDGNTATYWKSQNSEKGHNVVVDLGKSCQLKGFTYTPVATDEKAGTVFLYRFFVSQDGKNWIPCETSGEFSNIKNNPIKQEVQFKMVYTARYIRFEALREMDNRPFVTMGELGILQ